MWLHTFNLTLVFLHTKRAHTRARARARAEKVKYCTILITFLKQWKVGKGFPCDK